MSDDIAVDTPVVEPVDNPEVVTEPVVEPVVEPAIDIVADVEKVGSDIVETAADDYKAIAALLNRLIDKTKAEFDVARKFLATHL